jgi:hypothetical protein
MKLQNLVLIAVALIIPGTAWAYGEGGTSSGAGSCQQLKFSDFTPGNNSEAAPESTFSFFATGATYPNSIRVTIKGESVPLTVTPKADGYKVTGQIPDSVKGAHARINIDARGINQCEVTGGWLVKVTD